MHRGLIEMLCQGTVFIAICTTVWTGLLKDNVLNKSHNVMQHVPCFNIIAINHSLCIVTSILIYYLERFFFNYWGDYVYFVHSFAAAVCDVPSHFSCMWLFAILWMVAHQAPLSMGLSGQEYWRGFPCPPPGIFLTQVLSPHLLHFLYWQVGSLPLALPGSRLLGVLISTFL